MLKDIVELVETLNNKTVELCNAIKSADATTTEYKTLLDNFVSTMNLTSGLNKTLNDIAAEAEMRKDHNEVTEEVETNESNN